jgi:hypothetical protein
MEHIIKQNNAIDIYQEYFQDLGDSMSNEAPSAKSLIVYRFVSRLIEGIQTLSKEQQHISLGIQKKVIK